MLHIPEAATGCKLWKKLFFRKFAKYTEKHLLLSLFLTRGGAGDLTSLAGFSKNVSSRERVNPWLLQKSVIDKICEHVLWHGFLLSK